MSPGLEAGLQILMSALTGEPEAHPYCAAPKAQGVCISDAFLIYFRRQLYFMARLSAHDLNGYAPLQRLDAADTRIVFTAVNKSECRVQFGFQFNSLKPGPISRLLV